jgi:hypothetical protein
MARSRSSSRPAPDAPKPSTGPTSNQRATDRPELGRALERNTAVQGEADKQDGPSGSPSDEAKGASREFDPSDQAPRPRE